MHQVKEIEVEPEGFAVVCPGKGKRISALACWNPHDPAARTCDYFVGSDLKASKRNAGKPRLVVRCSYPIPSAEKPGAAEGLLLP